MTPLEKISKDIESCTKCPRLIRHCKFIAKEKKRAHKLESYWGKPVPSFGDPKARLLIVGLAPAAHGANRTGRMFTGDSSGDWLYRALHHVGFANQPTSNNRNDGLILNDVYISAAAHCAPPDNKPTLNELIKCRPYLLEELKALKHIMAVLALGKIGFDAVLTTLEEAGYTLPKPKPKFVHAGVFHVENMRLYSSYHPSRQNTNTGKLTREMWEGVFERIQKDLILH